VGDHGHVSPYGFKAHLAAFLDAYNFAKRLKTLLGLTTYEAICRLHLGSDPPHIGTTEILDLRSFRGTVRVQLNRS
jgi:hypothetical protein